MRITKVYTKVGDNGETSLVGGEMVRKTHPRIQAYGSVDELNAILGIVRSFWTNEAKDKEYYETIHAALLRIQNHLFNIGADLATPAEHRWEGMIRVGSKDVDWLETQIDQLNDSLAPLREFILPGGGVVSAFCHQARTVCRRTEREVLLLIEAEPSLDMGIVRYLNRLSDYLFVAGRWISKQQGEAETFWKKPNDND